MSYIHFTEEQKLRASSVDLAEFLRRQGEKLIPSGSEYRMTSDHSITIRGNEWWDHATKEGGGPISFVQNFFGLNYPEAVTRLLDGERSQLIDPAMKERKEPKKSFAPPPQNGGMRRLYAYLLKKRHIDREVLTTFVRAGLIYEDAQYHNAVFIGKDEHGVARHAHKRSTNSEGKIFRSNVEGSDPQYSFHWTGASDRLYVFEAPIDLLSFLSLYPNGWQAHSYVALCGVGEQAMLWMLKQNPNIQNIALCLDHDEAGVEASGRLAEVLKNHGYPDVCILRSEYKDWNEDVKAHYGLEAQSAEEHPQFIAAPDVCERISKRMKHVRMSYLEQDIPNLIDYYRTSLHWGHLDRAMDCMEQASAAALAAYGQELRQMGKQLSDAELSDTLCSCIHPHQNRGSLNHRHHTLAIQFQGVLAQSNNAGIRSPADKQRLADSWLELAAAFAQIPIKYEAEQIKQRKRHDRSIHQETEVVPCQLKQFC